MPAKQLDHWQRIPYGTPAWDTAYHDARNIVEGAFSQLKRKHGLDRENCQAMGLAPITLSMLALVVLHNLKEAAAEKLEEEGDPSANGDECTQPPGDSSACTPRSAVSSRRSATPPRAPP